MSERAAYIVSLKFAPGLKKEFMVLGENLKKKGFDVKYIISTRYSIIEGAAKEIKYIATQNNFSGILIDTVKFLFNNTVVQMFGNEPYFVLIYNPHLYNPLLARKLKRKYPKTKLALYLHDPYKSDKRPYGLMKSIYIYLVEIVQGLTVKYMDYIISPSEHSLTLFRTKYPFFEGKNYIAPLLIPKNKQLTQTERKHFSIVGGVHLATGHDTFVNLVNYVASQRLDFKFVLISSSNIKKIIEKLSEKGRTIIHIINNNVISDSEINEVIRHSFAVFRLDKEVTQSGVTPVSYMNGTPVIVRDIPGLRQHVIDKETGVVVPFDCMPTDLVNAMQFVKENINPLSINARNIYNEIWSEDNWDKYYYWLDDETDDRHRRL